MQDFYDRGQGQGVLGPKFTNWVQDRILEGVLETPQKLTTSREFIIKFQYQIAWSAMNNAFILLFFNLYNMHNLDLYIRHVDSSYKIGYNEGEH